MTPAAPLVSIITPSYNSAEFIGATLASVAAQDYAPLEHIVVDGGSTDGTLDQLRASRARWISGPDLGQTDALNKGLRLAQGEIIGWVNADDTYAPGAVAAAVAHLQAEPGIGLVFADCTWIDAAGATLDTWHTRPTTLDDLLLDGCIIAHQAAFVRRAVFETVGEFDANLRFVMDYEWLLRALAAFPARRVAGVWGSLRVWEGTKTSQAQSLFWPENVAVIERILAAHPVAPPLADEARRRVQLQLALTAAWDEDWPTAGTAFTAALAGAPPYGSWPALAENIVARCQRPSYLAVPPAEADDLLDRVLRVPGLRPELRAHLHQVRAFGAWQQHDHPAARRHAAAALRASPAVRGNRGLWAVWARAWLRPAAPARRPR